uniref:Uncharacterized protein n=1 Tax=Poecilia latipinna TaxID=48699 RepID=A0A3B3UXW8_9TELE
MYRKSEHLGCQFLGLSLLQLSELSLRCIFIKQRPEVTAYLLISVIVVGLDGFHKLSQGTFILTEKERNMTQY